MSVLVRVAIGVGVAAAVGAIGATVWIGIHVREDTVVAKPYEEGLRETCDLGAGPCTRPLPGGGEVTLELSPRPLRTMVSLGVRALVRDAREPGGAAVSVSFSMPGMEMGENRVKLEAAGPNAFAGSAVLVRCPSGRRMWSAAVAVLRAGGAPRDEVRFPFTVGE